jgi:hypothetical protein
MVAVPPGIGVGFTTGFWTLSIGGFDVCVVLLFGIFHPLIKY